jgi:hypothetical protein
MKDELGATNGATNGHTMAVAFEDADKLDYQVPASRRSVRLARRPSHGAATGAMPHEGACCLCITLVCQNAQAFRG